MLVLLGACTRAASPSSTPSPTTAPVSKEQPESDLRISENSEGSIREEKPSIPDNPSEPILSNALTRDCKPGRPSGAGFETVGLSEGGKAVNFTLKDIHGSEFILSQLLAEKPVVMVFGSFT